MFTGNKAIFEFLHAYIKETFSRESVPSPVFYADEASRPTDRCLHKFYRGPVVLKGYSGFPCAWLEFGQITDVKLNRMPQGYCYELRYQMPIFVQLSKGAGRDYHETYRSDDGLPWAIGDIISEVVEKVWADLHLGFSPGGNFQYQNGRFVKTNAEGGQLALSGPDWWVQTWTVDVNGDVVDTIAEWKDVMDSDPTSRAKTINWDFTVFEQESLR